MPFLNTATKYVRPSSTRSNPNCKQVKGAFYTRPQLEISSIDPGPFSKYFSRCLVVAVAGFSGLFNCNFVRVYRMLKKFIGAFCF